MKMSELNTRGAWFSVLRPGEAIPPRIRNLVTQATQTSIVRVAGGCSGMTPEQRASVIPYFVESFRGHGDGYSGVIMSGGTVSGDGQKMVTNVPSALAVEYPCIALGSTPRTADMSIRSGGTLVVSDYGDSLDPDQHGTVLVEKSAADVLEWDGDLDLYLDFMEGLRREADWNAAVIIFNGGGVTKKELMLALQRRIPVIVVEGSGRAADEFVNQVRGGEGSFDLDVIMASVREGLVSICQFDNPASLETVLIERGLLS